MTLSEFQPEDIKVHFFKLSLMDYIGNDAISFFFSGEYCKAEYFGFQRKITLVLS